MPGRCVMTTTATAIFVNMTVAETTIVTSLHLASGLDARNFKLLTKAMRLEMF